MKSAMKCDKHCELQESWFFDMSGYTHKTEVHVGLEDSLTCCSQPTLKLQMGKNHMAKTHRGITYISVLFFEFIINYIYIFGAFVELIT